MPWHMPLYTTNKPYATIKTYATNKPYAAAYASATIALGLTDTFCEKAE